MKVEHLFFVLLLIVGNSTHVYPQEFEPRTYSVTPVGSSYFALGYGLSAGNVLLDPSLPIENLDADLHGVIARYTRSLSLFDRTAKVKVVLPWSTGDWLGLVDGEAGARSATGLGDMRLAMEMVLFGARAMSVEEAASFTSKTLIGARVQTILPTGDYDNRELVNLGTNRWTFVPEVGLSHTVGRWTLEGALGAWLFTTNDDFVGGNRLEQNPLFVAKFHAIRTIRPGFWWAVAVGYGYGGRTIVNGASRDTLQENFRLTGMIAFPLSARTGLSVTVGSGRNAGAGADFDALAIGYQVAF